MGYRFDNKPPIKPEDKLPRFEVRNGAIVDIAFPCYYLDVVTSHNSDEHDHLGWPTPTRPDATCQWPFHRRTGEWEWIDFENPHPIDLTSDYEGYDSAEVIMDEDITELTMTASLDSNESNVVYLRVEANFDLFEDKPKEYKFTLFAHAPARTYQGKAELERLDQVVRGIIVVLPGNKI